MEPPTTTSRAVAAEGAAVLGDLWAAAAELAAFSADAARAGGRLLLARAGVSTRTATPPDEAAAGRWGDEAFRDLDALGFLAFAAGEVGAVLLFGRRLVVAGLDRDLLHAYVLRRVRGWTRGRAFRVVYFHTGCTYAEHSPGLDWLAARAAAAPAELLDRLEAVLVVHPDAKTALAAALLGPLLPAGLRAKVRAVGRVEFLPAGCGADDPGALPAYVRDHDVRLEADPLLDFGVVQPEGAAGGLAGGGFGVPPPFVG